MRHDWNGLAGLQPCQFTSPSQTWRARVPDQHRLLFRTASIDGREMTLWVRTDRFRPSAPCRLWPRYRPQSRLAVWSKRATTGTNGTAASSVRLVGRRPYILRMIWRANVPSCANCARRSHARISGGPSYGEDAHVNCGRCALGACAMTSRPYFAWFNTSCIKVGPTNCVDGVVPASAHLPAV